MQISHTICGVTFDTHGKISNAAHSWPNAEQFAVLEFGLDCLVLNVCQNTTATILKRTGSGFWREKRQNICCQIPPADWDFVPAQSGEKGWRLQWSVTREHLQSICMQQTDNGNKRRHPLSVQRVLLWPPLHRPWLSSGLERTNTNCFYLAAFNTND